MRLEMKALLLVLTICLTIQLVASDCFDSYQVCIYVSNLPDAGTGDTVFVAYDMKQWEFKRARFDGLSVGINCKTAELRKEPFPMDLHNQNLHIYKEGGDGLAVNTISIGTCMQDIFFGLPTPNSDTLTCDGNTYDTHLWLDPEDDPTFYRGFALRMLFRCGYGYSPGSQIRVKKTEGWGEAAGIYISDFPDAGTTDTVWVASGDPALVMEFDGLSVGFNAPDRAYMKDMSAIVYSQVSTIPLVRYWDDGFILYKEGTDGVTINTVKTFSLRGPKMFDLFTGQNLYTESFGCQEQQYQGAAAHLRWDPETTEGKLSKVWARGSWTYLEQGVQTVKILGACGYDVAQMGPSTEVGACHLLTGLDYSNCVALEVLQDIF